MLMKFNRYGYSYNDVDGSSFFEESKDHEGIFTFLASDLTDFPQKLEGYFSKIIDLTTLKLTGYIPRHDDFWNLGSLFDDIHPYFEYMGREELDSAIGEYFNALLIQNSYDTKKYTYSPIYDEGWYMDTFIALYPEDGFNDKTETAKKYYKIYQQIVKPDDDDDPPYVELPPTGFHSLLSYQDHISSMIYWILDVNTPYLKELSIPERASVYGRVHATMSDHPHMVVVKQISFSDPHSRYYRSGYKRSEIVDGEEVQWNILGDLYDFHKGTEHIHPEALEELQSIVESVKQGYFEEIYEEYEVNSFYEVLFLEVYHMILDRTLVKKCRNCGRYFVVKNLNVEYCSRLIDPDEESLDNRTCSDVGPKRSYMKKLEEDLPLKFYDRAYKTHYARINSGKMTKQEFFLWHQEAKEKLEMVRANTYDFEEFKIWLKK